MDTKNLCMGCMTEKRNEDVCPHCGYDEKEPIGPLVLPPRTRLMNGHYLVGRVLGKPGGFGITYLAWDVKLETKVAIKEFLPRDLAGRNTDHTTVVPHHSDDKDLFEYGLERFLQEARTLAKFDHTNVVRVRAFFEENGTAYLVMNYYEGVSLAQYLKNSGGRIDEKLAINIMMPIMDGLREVHEKGFLHRDIKPQNIYLTEGGVPILLDFGAARFAMGEKSRSLSVVITPGFAPFEQYQRRGEQGVWTDIYSCGATLYYILTGEEPPAASDRITNDELVLPEKLVSKISPRVSDTVMKALSMSIEKRPKSVREFQDMLMGWHPKQKEDFKTPDKKPVDDPEKKRKNFYIVFGVISIILIGITFLILFNRGGKVNIDKELFNENKKATPKYQESTTPLTFDDISERLKSKAKNLHKNKWGYWEAEFEGNIQMVYIPAGSFIMGTESGYKDEKPSHKVHLDGYWIGKYEITYEQFKRFIDASGYKTVAEENENAYAFDGEEWEEDMDATWAESDYFDEDMTDHPVVCVSWSDCLVFTAWLANKTGLNFRLPTEAEWEKASRGIDGRKYPWGNDFAAIPRSREQGGNILGKVILEDGSAVPGVIITLYDDNDKKVLSEVTNEFGKFRLNGLPASNNYAIKAELEGFKTVIRKNTQVKNGFISKVDIVLETTTLWETITISPEGTELIENVQKGSANFADFQFWYEFERSWSNKSVDDGYSVTSPVGAIPSGVSPYGVMDMSGNVWEWCLDGYEANYYNYSPGMNPRGPSYSPKRVIRGGGWNSNVDEIRSSKRSSKPPSYSSDFLGFRIVMTEK